MRFGVIKTIVENRFIKFFGTKEQKKDFKLFESILLKDDAFKRLFFIYDTLKENKKLDRTEAEYLIEDLTKEAKSLSISEKSKSLTENWKKSVVLENRYTIIDDLIYGDALVPEKKSIAKKQIVEGLMKEKISESKKPSIPLKSFVKLANKNVENLLESLPESDKKQVMEVLKKSNSKELFEELKKDTLDKIKILSENNDTEFVSVLNEIQTKIENTNYTKKEYYKLYELNKNLVI
jgi:hypothetical protein